MTDINITHFFNNATPFDYSASKVEKGENAGRDTWQAACTDSTKYPLINLENADDFKQHVRGFGAWNEAEIAKWSDIELNALFVQMVSGDMREGGLDVPKPNWEEYEADAESGRVSGNIYRGDDGQIYYSIES